MRTLGVKILAPSAVGELRQAAEYALSSDSPVAVRYCNGDIRGLDGVKAVEALPQHPIDKWQLVREGREGVLLAVGPRCLGVALKAAEISGRSIAVYNCTSVSPLDGEVLLKIGSKAIGTLEEGVAAGGFVWGGRRLLIFASENLSVGQGTIGEQMEFAGLSPSRVAEKMVELIKQR